MKCTEIKPHLLLLTEKELSKIAMYPDPTYSKTEASMCAWEHLLENQVDFEELNGVGNARACCISLGYAIHIGFCVAYANDQTGMTSFDWDFTPWFMENCVIWDTDEALIHNTPLLKDDWIDRCRSCFEPEPSDEDLLRECQQVLNRMPNQSDLAAKINRRLKA